MLLFQSPSWKSEKKQKEQKQVLMFAKLIAEKISSTVCQGLRKEQKRNSDIYQTECRKGNADNYNAIEKAKSKRTKEMELA